MGNVKNIIENLKTNYEDYWKNLNQINTSIKLPLKMKIYHCQNHLKVCLLKEWFVTKLIRIKIITG